MNVEIDFVVYYLFIHKIEITNELKVVNVEYNMLYNSEINKYIHNPTISSLK